MSKYWQVAAGSRGRDYSEQFLRFGMAFVGNPKTMEKVEEGDVLILKAGVKGIRAAGQVVNRGGTYKGLGDKNWLRDFDGWDLSAYCYVDWRRPSMDVPVTGLRQGQLVEVRRQNVKDAADRIVNGEIPHENPEPKPEPEPTKCVDDNTLISFLIKQGLRVSQADELTNTISRIRRLADYYHDCVPWERVREHETRTFLVIPLLLALGWAEQQLKVELPCGGRKAVDIAGFRRPYTGKRSDNENCTLIIETKGFASGLSYAEDQAKRYSDSFESCKLVLVTNGYCYKAYRKEGDEFRKDPSAYLNLRNPQDAYPIDPANVRGATEAIKCLLPSYVNDEAYEAT